VRNAAYIAVRGGKHYLGQITDVVRIKWGRVRDDVSEAELLVNFESEECQRLVSEAEPCFHEIVIERDGQRVWEGPITYKRMERGQAELVARDPVFFMQRTVCKRKWSSAYPNVESVIDRAERVIRKEMVPLEQAGANILDHIVTYKNPDDAKTARVSAAYSQYVYDDMEALAARGGLDYTMVLRSLYLHDTHYFIGQGRMLTDDDFLDSLSVITYGVELSVGSYATDNLGTKGAYIYADEYYGPIELLASAYEIGSTTDKITVKELEEQAERNARHRYPAPTVIRVPENVQMNPASVDELMPYFIPGTAFPLRTTVTGQTYEAVMKFDQLNVEETGDDGEVVKVKITAPPVGSGLEEVVD
jgi:hypothetical protein